MRPDLVARRQKWQGREYWTIKDPLALRYYRFEDEEYLILSMLDGQSSAEKIREHFEQRFAPQRLSAAQLQHLLAMLHRSNLLVADAAGQGEQLLTRDRQRRRRKWLGTLANFLAIRLRGIDPDRLLTWLDQRVGWLFSAPAAICALCLILSAVLLVAAEFDTFLSRLPTFRAFFAAQNWLLLAVTLCLTKVLHEFGHGLSCKRFGGECHEMGVMLLVLTPCLYCDVSDAWMIPSKWRRAAIGAAGMYVELILASGATFLWWFSEPGLLNHLCLNVMFVCSISTLLFNANPLMRFDGYYILSDLIEIPNLRQKSAIVIQRKLGAWVLGLRERPDPFLPARRQWLFAAYSVASAIYSWLVSLSIFWFLYRVLEPYGLKIFGQLLATAMVVSLLVVPLVRLGKLLFEPTRSQDVNKLRATVVLGTIAALVIGLLCIPLPYYVACTFEVQPRGAASVYVDVAGQLREVAVRSGPVAAGQPIARLDDVETRLALERLIAQRETLSVRVENMRQRAATDDQALLELSQVEEALLSLNTQVGRLQKDQAKLTICAPQAGVVVPPPPKPAEPHERMQLASWSGRPLDARNIGAYLPASTLVCRIADAGKLEAILAIDQEELDFVRPGQTVDLLLASRPGERQSGRIERIAEENMQTAPARLRGKGGVGMATQTGKDGLQRPLSVVYQASVPLDDGAGNILVGTTGTARIRAGWQPLAERLWRSACRTFRFKM
jgi:putative peptide zinc metalloprotease protein